MQQPVFISSDFIEKNTDYLTLIKLIKEGFAADDTIVPPRHHHDFPNIAAGINTTMLIMPAWQEDKDTGVKIITINPNNSRFDIPSIQGTYLYMNAINGELKAVLDAKKLTVKRTAAASALASSLLSKYNSRSLLMIGTGALSCDLIKAHSIVRPIEKVYVWGRNYNKAKTVCSLLSGHDFTIEPIERISEKVSDVDIISVATLSKTPLLKGSFIKAGQHIDLVGSYKPDMRESDDATIIKSNIYTDVKESALKESGDLKIPLDNRLIKSSDIIADLFGLCKGEIQGRNSTDEITLFKSVGHALEDLVAARFYYNIYTQGK
ncbi:MAG: ornithine cyclodeaminase family protein [Saprospiraceae bacterium]